MITVRDVGMICLFVGLLCWAIAGYIWYNDKNKKRNPWE